jgi:hypothetical protein
MPWFLHPPPVSFELFANCFQGNKIAATKKKAKLSSSEMRKKK